MLHVPGKAPWLAHPHKVPGYASVTISLKPIGGMPGDATDAQMEAVADLAERYGFDEIRVSHEQNLVLPHVAKDDLPAIYAGLVEPGLATANAGLVTDIIACRSCRRRGPDLRGDQGTDRTPSRRRACQKRGPQAHREGPIGDCSAVFR